MKRPGDIDMSGLKWVYISALIGFAIFLAGFLAQVFILHSYNIFLFPFEMTQPLPVHSLESFKVESRLSSSQLPIMAFKISKSMPNISIILEPTIAPSPAVTQSSTESESPATFREPLENALPDPQKVLQRRSQLAGLDESLGFREKVFASLSKKPGAGEAMRKLITQTSVGGPIGTFIAAKNHLPIVLLACNRPEVLSKTIKSLMEVRGVLKENVAISQDGLLQSVSDIAKSYGFRLFQNAKNSIEPGFDESSPIAKHYKFSLEEAFKAFPDAPAIIVIEDDLLFSPDFLEYMEAVGPILDVDQSVMAVSAWNDNGFIDKVRNPHALVRTNFFPGLGWLLSRKLFTEELDRAWPLQHWDHWLRSPEITRDREIVHPEVPRSYHNGIKGTFMNVDTHNKYFRDIAYNTDSTVTWQDHYRLVETVGGATTEIKLPIYTEAVKRVYESRIREMIYTCTHAKSVSDILQSEPALYCLWIDVNPSTDYGPSEFEVVAKFFGIWHEHKRGAHNGLHEFRWNGETSYILLINVHDTIPDNYRALMPERAVFMQPSAFDPALMLDMHRQELGLIGFPARLVNQNCDEVCAAAGKKCDKNVFALLNTCKSLKEKFPCKSCHESFGFEQPAYVDPAGDSGPSAGACLFSSQLDLNSVCSAKHQSTKRLCACK